ncbi:IclR family transcriptional regulator [Lactiplantibacillus daowaiensis]|uniref:IclR family transcriptional regulator n=1 Tax=Lactiplantibacillus daowaiensis TaxID=2559918 RepID=A0ABW1RZQ1_9LACO|nr:IclR family transcriptional regulator [Lactiplantibacillus daowaiensis]
MTQYLSGTLAKGFKILEYLQQHTTATLNEVAFDLALNKTTAFRLLASLVELHYVKKSHQTYTLATNNQLLTQFNPPVLNWVAVPITTQITKKYQVTAYIGILNGPNVVITQVIGFDDDLSEYAKIGSAAPINESALGKAIVAYLPRSKVTALVTQLKSTATKYTLNDQALAQNLAITRQQGYSLDDEESSFGIRCLAVPIMKDGQVIASLGVAGPLTRLKRQRLKQIAHDLQTCRTEIGLQLT